MMTESESYPGNKDIGENILLDVLKLEAYEGENKLRRS